MRETKIGVQLIDNLIRIHSSTSSKKKTSCLCVKSLTTFVERLVQVHNICVKRRDAVAHRGSGVLQAWRSATLAGLPKQLMDRLQSVQNATARLTTFSRYGADYTGFRCQNVRTYFVLAGSAGVSLPPRLCTWLPGFRSSAHVTPQRTSTTALFDYISAGHSTYCVFYHWRLHLSSDCCIDLEQFAGVGPVITVAASFPQQTENRTFCLVLQPWRSYVSLHWLL